MTLVVFDIECLEGTVVKELGIFMDGIVLGYTFLPPNDYKPTFQAKSNTKSLHGKNWNNGKVDYSDLRTIIHQHCSPTTEYFAKGLENVKSYPITCVRMWKIWTILDVQKPLS